MVRHQLPYIVPEWYADAEFSVNAGRLIAQIKAKAQGHDIKPTLVGPLTLLWLGKKEEFGCRVATLLPKLLPAYAQLLRELAAEGVDWIQIDEPILAVDAPQAYLDAFPGPFTKSWPTPAPASSSAPTSLLLPSIWNC